jgi:hypothetical protein
MEYKGYKVDDNKIDEYVEKLDISIAEACDLILEEEGKIEESAETKKAIAESTKNAPRRYEKGTSARKKTEKVRKVDETKGFLLKNVKTLIEGLGASATEIKTETELKFDFEGASYTFKLTKHRPPKTCSDFVPGPTDEDIIRQGYIDKLASLEYNK